MPYGDSECKTFFSRWLPPTIFSGVFFALGVVGFADLNSRGDPTALHLLLSFAAIVFIFWQIFFWRVRFERDSAVIWYCTVFPSRIDYAEVSGMRRLFCDAKHPGVPSHVEFFLKNGKRKQWNLDFFVPAVREEIVQELKERIQFPEPADSPDGGDSDGELDTGEELQEVTAWTEKACRPHRAEMILVCAVGGIMLVLGIGGVFRQLAWDDRVRAWDKVDGIILRNTTKRVRSGKHTRNVADVAYEYTYKGTRCTGTRIVYDSDTFPKLKPGAHQQVIVNPEDPRDSAIMFWYSGYWWLMRYTDCMFFGLIFLIMSGIFTSLVTRKVPAIPESLKKYLKTFSQEQYDAALKRERPGVPSIGVEMNHPMEYREDSRYGILRERKTLFSKIVFALVFLAGVALAIAVPPVWFVVAVIGTVFFFLFFPGMTVFDFEEKRILRCRLFRPEKFSSMRSVSFAEIDHLSVSDSTLNRKKHGGRFIGLVAVKRDGTKIPICGTSCRNLGVLLELLPELAEKMGHLPILFY